MQNGQFFDLFLNELRDVYSAETQIIENLPKLINAITTKELKDAFKKHLEETKEQKKRLEKVFSKLGLSPAGEQCEGMKGLIKEGDKLLSKYSPGVLLDAALIAAAQKIEHYEMATYGTLRTFAQHMEMDEIEDMLQEILDEEGKTNKKLTKLAEGTWLTTGINVKAAHR
jgi:ferritin-like metal-binding protein YciE